MSETDAEFVDRLVGRTKGGDIGYVLVVSSREEQTRLLSLARRGAESADTITALRAENEKLRAALHEAADELDAYYRAEYCGDHPYSKRKLAEAMRQNPARAALEEKQ